MLFSWKKNSLKERIISNKNNNDLIKEIEEKGITDKNILGAIKSSTEVIYQ